MARPHQYDASVFQIQTARAELARASLPRMSAIHGPNRNQKCWQSPRMPERGMLTAGTRVAVVRLDMSRTGDGMDVGPALLGDHLRADVIVSYAS